MPGRGSWVRASPTFDISRGLLRNRQSIARASLLELDAKIVDFDLRPGE